MTLAREPELISPEGAAQQRALHETGQYGVEAEFYAPMVSSIIKKMGVTHLLDYGCGSNCTLARSLKLESKLTYQAYDPGVERFA